MTKPCVTDVPDLTDANEIKSERLFVLAALAAAKRLTRSALPSPSRTARPPCAAQHITTEPAFENHSKATEVDRVAVPPGLLSHIKRHMQASDTDGVTSPSSE